MHKLQTGAKSTTYVHDGSRVVVDGELIAFLVAEASKDPLGRARLCLHTDTVDTVQEMIIVMSMSSYVRPHKHDGKSETFHMIEGKMKVIIFDENGASVEQVVLECCEDKPYIHRLAEPLWHTVVPLTDYVVFHEITSGPFDRSDTHYAPWSPRDEQTDAVEEFMKTYQK